MPTKQAAITPRPVDIVPVDIVGVGLNALDTTIRVPQFPTFNSKLEILSSNVYPGGQVASALIACQRWGLRTRYVGKIGDDFAARLHREIFVREGVEAHLLEVPHCESQLSYILVEQNSGERTVLWKRDTRLDILPEELSAEWIEGARLLHVDGHPTPPAIAAARIAKRSGIPVMADLDNLYPGVEVLLEHIDYLFSSREFPERVTGISDLFRSLPEIVRRFGCKVAGATLGTDGVLAWDDALFHYCPAFRVEAVDTTGAGDIFHAGFAYSLLNALTLDEAMKFSCAAAALNCTAPGARGGVRSLKEIHEIVTSGRQYPQIYSGNELSKRSEAARDASSKT
jgi:sulfofructose kinase